MNRNSIISWSVFILLAIFAELAYLFIQTEPKVKGLPSTLRSGLDRNEQITRNLPTQRVVEFPKSAAVLKARVNGKYGLKSKLDTANYRMLVIHPETKDTVRFKPEQIKNLPKTEVVFDFKCIEGWNQITWWGGLRFSDFVKKFYPGLLDADGRLKYAYVGLMTPDKAYYVGIDSESMMQEKTLLCYELSGQPLPLEQGYPIRLIIPVKYGIKHLKRIGYISFSNERPRDFWFEKGYDYDAGH